MSDGAPRVWPAHLVTGGGSPSLLSGRKSPTGRRAVSGFGWPSEADGVRAVRATVSSSLDDDARSRWSWIAAALSNVDGGVARPRRSPGKRFDSYGNDAEAYAGRERDGQRGSVRDGG